MALVEIEGSYTSNTHFDERLNFFPTQILVQSFTGKKITFINSFDRNIEKISNLWLRQIQVADPM